MEMKSVRRLALMAIVRTALAGLAVLACSLQGSVASAHEIGTTRVTAQFDPDRTYLIEVITDAQALLEKVETVTDAAGPTPADADVTRIESRLHALEAVVRGRVRLAFDGQPSAPALRIAVVPAGDANAPPLAHLQFRGEYPSEAAAFTWMYGWTFASYALTVRPGMNGEGGAMPVAWLEGGEMSPPLPIAVPPPTAGWRETAIRYLGLGFTHILPLGLDHVLFVLGLFLLNSRPRPLLAQVSAFTIAHSITLGLSMYGVVTAPARIVEPLITLSIAYVAVENLLVSELRSWRVVVVFGCGLLHGLGFAGVLGELGMPRGAFATALASFNVGVEVAQLTVIAVAYLLLGVGTSRRTWYRERVVIPASVCIACVALYWTVERLA